VILEWLIPDIILKLLKPILQQSTMGVGCADLHHTASLITKNVENT